MAPHSTSAVVASLLDVQATSKPGRFTNFSSCFRNFIKPLIMIFETSVEHICCEINSADDIASGEAVRYKRLLSGYI